MDRDDRRMNQEPGLNVWIARVVGVLLLAGAIALFYFQHESPKVEPAPPPQLQPEIQPPAPAPEPAVQEPEPEPQPQAPAVPLPALNESDAAIQDALAGLVSREALNQFLVPGDVIRRIVATVDNLPREKLAVRLWPILPTTGKFLPSGQEGNRTLNPENYARYAPIVRLVAAIDTKKLASVYLRYYPLFQQAYVELGYPSKQFNGRLLEVIDHLLAAPEVKGPVKLVQPAVYFKFADAKLESLSTGQKTLIRVGPDNAAIIKAKLREFRSEVAGQTRKQ